MELEPEDVQKFSVALDKWVRTLETVKPSASNGVGNATIMINAGGFGVWASATCCVAMLVGLLIGSVFVAVDVSAASSARLAMKMEQQAKDKAQDDQVSRLNDYIQAIYSVAPQLKPKDKDK